MADYGMLGSFGSDAVSQLNYDLIEKLKNADKKAILTPIDDQLEKITGLDAETGKALDTVGEQDKFLEIKAQVLDLKSKISLFDANNPGTNAFDLVSASTSGKSAVFDAADVSGLEEGTTNITVNQLAKKDVFQSVELTEDEVKNKVVPIVSDDANGDGDNDDDVDADLVRNSGLSITVGDETFNFYTVTNATRDKDKVDDMEFKTFEELADEINENDKLVASIESVGDDKYKLVIKAKDSGLANELYIKQNNVNWGFDNTEFKSVDEVKATDTVEKNSVFIINGEEFTGNEVHTYAMSGTVDDGSSSNGDATTVKFLGADVETKQGNSAEDFVKDIIADKADVISTWNSNNSNKKIKDIIASTDDAKKVVIIFDESAGSVDPISTSDDNGIDFDDNSVEKRDYDSDFTYDDLKTQIDDSANFDATFEDGNDGDSNTAHLKITLQSGSAYSDISIDQDTKAFHIANSNDTHTQTAQNLEAVIDGINYDVSSNSVTIQGNLKMTAVELGDSSINITKDTSGIISGMNDFITSYNSLVDIIETEAQSADSSIHDISSLKSILSSVKEKLFSNFGKNGDQNLFNYGLELDLQGHLSIDSEKFGTAVTDHYDDLKDLFLGNTTDVNLAATDSTKFLGMGTMISSYLDALDDGDGLLTRYEDGITDRKEALEKEREDEIKKLDSKYDTLAQQFSAYAGIISSMESSFGGLKMMIDQSVAKK